jgi:hypothetical protein
MRKNQMCAGAARADGRMKAILSTKEMIAHARIIAAQAPEKAATAKREEIVRMAAILVDPDQPNSYKASIARLMAMEFEADARNEASK